eukprot:TRINITY_DN78824_c0_g1_i1.p1 TRINITY_DN78824_c0_g1~~TRINITY_DN78824_c0_g1_i1.p1  ORF type:complete len:335 (-),score=52.78 TRINITY_DN78824_c0_g1_i1:39-1043(-)
MPFHWICTVWSLSAVPGVLGSGPKSRSTRDGDKASSLESLLHPGSDPNSPHAAGFEPRPGPGEGGGIWDFGAVHATLNHILDSVQEGHTPGVHSALHSFSQKHDLGLASAMSDDVIEASIRAASAAAGLRLAEPAPKPSELLAPRAAAEPDDGSARRGLRMLVLQAGLGSFELRSLPFLLRLRGHGNASHEIVSLEIDPQLSDAGSRLLQHALGPEGDDMIRHIPLLPSEETSIAEVMETLEESYELPSFDLVVLEGGDRLQQSEQIKELISSEAFHNGTVVHAVGPASDDPSTLNYVEQLSHGKHKFHSEIHRLEDGTAAVISSLRQHDGSEL